VYNLNEYAFIVGDPLRMRAYTDAIARVVRPGSVVVDIGAGGGVLSILAAKAGARRVYAVEAVPLAWVVADSAQRSGVAGVVTFVHGKSTDVTLPESADVIVSDLRGVLPLFRKHLPSIVDARERWLRPGGALIPRRDVLHAALVEAPDLYHRHVGVFDRTPYGVDMTALRDLAVNRWYLGLKEEVALIGDATGFASLDYADLVDPNLDARVGLEATRPATAHGFCVWFDTILADDVFLSNSPRDEETVYGRAFFPFEQPLALEAGDRIRVRLRAKLTENDYVWTWDTDAPSRLGTQFRQSTFRGIAIDRRQETGGRRQGVDRDHE
jgi:protein arginine N-methyltransferase 1